MSSPDTIPRRYRPPSSMGLLYVLAAVVTAVSTIAVVFAVLAFFRLNELGDENRKALESTFTSRRSSAFLSCRERETLKTDLRSILVRFRVDPSTLPSSSTGRGVALAPYPGGCRRYALTIVPESNRP